jgi:DNA-binding transcriptional LysR family regulator
MNIHHLELFYYVAKHGGISAAVRRIPYGIQQPAVSWQILQLERYLGVALFVRRPFALTDAGERLFRHVSPFFEGLLEVESSVRQGAAGVLRIAAAEKVQRDYLPGILTRLKERFPGLVPGLITARLPEAEAMLAEQKVDIAVGELGGKRASGVHSRELVRLEPVLLVRETSRWRTADQLLNDESRNEALIALPADDPVRKAFFLELGKRRIEWFCGLEVQSLDLVGRYVAEGFGVGIGLKEPSGEVFPGCRQLALNGFPTHAYGVVWMGALTPVQAAFIDVCRDWIAGTAAAVEGRVRKGRTRRG